MVIWHSVALSFNECLVSLITSKCDSWVLGLKRKVPRFTCHNPAVSKVAITPPHPSPPLDLRARLNYPTASPRPLTAALAGVSFPRRSHLSGWEISQCSSASAKATDIFDQRALSLRARRRKWGEQSQRGWNITPPPPPSLKRLFALRHVHFWQKERRGVEFDLPTVPLPRWAQLRRVHPTEVTGTHRWTGGPVH